MITIIAASTYNRPDFIPLQYESIKKHVKCPFKYIVVNNAKFSFIDGGKQSEILYDQIKNTCKELGIDSYDIGICERTLNKAQSGTIANGKYTSDPYACNYSIQWTFENIISNIEGKSLIIDSDFFFIDDIDFDNIMDNYECGYIPQYRGHRKDSETVEASVKYMWNMFCIFDTNKNPKLKEINWHMTPIKGIACDVGAQTHFFIEENKDMSQLFFEEHSIYEFKRIEDNKIFIHYCLNANSNYHIILDSSYELLDFKCLERYSENKTFEYEIDKENYPEYIIDVLKKIIFRIEKYIDIFPSPLRLGFVKKFDDLSFFGVHYRSGANYLDYSTDQYNYKKTYALEKILQL